jgi:very-short-patch-repair endonuclease
MGDLLFAPEARGRPSLVARLEASPRAHLRSELLNAFSERQVRAAIARGAIVRILPAVYVATRHASDFRTRCDAALLWAADRALLGGTSAAYVYGIAEAAPSHVTLVTPRDVRLRAPSWVTLLQPSVALAPLRIDGLQTVGVADAVIQAWSQLPRDQAASLVLNAARERHITATQLATRAALYPRIRDRRAFNRLVIDLAGGAESYLERVAMTRVFSTRDFATFTRQTPVRVRGRRYVLDMYDADARLAVELDGRRFHGGDTARRRDLARDAELASVGITTIRLTFEDVVKRPAWCRTRVASALAARRRGRAH